VTSAGREPGAFNSETLKQRNTRLREPLPAPAIHPARKKNPVMTTLSGKIALITGASRGIGAAVAKRLAADGASVAIIYSKGAAAAAQVVNDIESAGGKAIAIKADAADAKAVAGAVDRTVATFGRLDVLVNNAGTAIPKPFEETTLEEMDRVIDINLRGVFIATQAALKHLRDGAALSRSGPASARAWARRDWWPKGAVKMFTQDLSREIGRRGITVKQYPTRPHRHRSQPRRRRLGDAPDREHGAEAVRPCGRYRRYGRVRRWPQRRATSRARALRSTAGPTRRSSAMTAFNGHEMVLRVGTTGLSFKDWSLFQGGTRKFESALLQRRVRKLSVRP
jgi:3-oxoacyl-[acyl-carrier protein] reductase